MSTQDSEGQPRWWRRSRDLALHAARESRSSAAEAMFDLESLQKDLPGLMSAHQDLLAAQQHKGRTRDDRVTQAWQQVSQQADAAIRAYLDLDSQFNRDKDYEEPEANRLAAAFEDSARKMREVVPYVQRFRESHGDALLAAHNRTLSIPRAIAEAEASLSEAQKSYAHVQAVDLTDAEAVAAYRTATSRLEAAKVALQRRSWSEASREAEAAKSVAGEVAARLATLEKQAQEVQNGFLSVRTRRDALQTQADRLPPLMSDLRRRYTAGSWRHLDDAPERVSAAMSTVNSGLVALEKSLQVNPLDVPQAAAMLRQVRAAASDVDAIIRSAQDTLRRLDEVSADPESLLVGVRRKTLDARRFLSNMPSEKAQRFAYTFDNIAARTERLVADTKKAHPDWGNVIAEAESIESALDAMIRSARTS